MPNMSKKNVIGLACGDLHLMDKPPAARAGERDWFFAQKRVLVQLKELVEKYEVPIIYAGDTLDYWDCSPGLINLALRHLPKGYGVAGQHELPYHSFDSFDRSALCTLLKADKLNFLHENGPVRLEGMDVYGASWGQTVTPFPLGRNELDIAVIHRFIWCKGHGFPGAPKEGHINDRELNKELRNYDIVICGDNHKPFTARLKSGTLVYNCGSLMRRHIDEVDHKPSVGLIYSDGSMERHYLNTSKDAFIKGEALKQAREQVADVEKFVKSLRRLSPNTIMNFDQALKHYIDRHGKRISDPVRAIIAQACHED
jgi:hypothetical protein